MKRAERQPMWSAEAQRIPAYQATGLLTAGFAGESPQEAKIRDGGYPPVSLARDAPVLAFWADFFGTQPGDRLTMRIEGPDGTRIRDGQYVFDRWSAARTRWAGTAMPGSGWPIGMYHGVLSLTRGSIPVVKAERDVEIK